MFKTHPQLLNQKSQLMKTRIILHATNTPSDLKLTLDDIMSLAESNPYLTSSPAVQTRHAASLQGLRAYVITCRRA